MITQSFDINSDAFINPIKKDNAVKCDVIIATFSNEIEEFVVNKFNAVKINEFRCVNGLTPIYVFKYKNKTFGFYKTLLGAPASAGILEDSLTMLECNKILVFGSCGTLDKNCCGKVIVPTFAYRDEGTSYHYAKADDYIEIKNSKIVANFMEKHKIPYVMGKIWTTDGFYRETKNNLAKRRKDGCVAVDMECSALQAVCDFRKKDLFYFLLSGDVLDAPEWDETGLREANHNFNNFDIALNLAFEL